MAIGISALFKTACPKNILAAVQIEGPMVQHIHTDQQQ